MELLVSVAIMGLLTAILIPFLGQAREKATVSRIMGELRSIEAILELYAADHDRHYPPPSVSCDPGEVAYAYQLPKELVNQGYVGGNTNSGIAVMRDPFNRAYPYRYAAPERYWQNGSFQEYGLAIWVPSDFPDGQSASGHWEDTTQSAFAWGVWSVGPRATKQKGLNARAPAAQSTWYQHTGDNGVIGLMRVRNGRSFFTL